VNIGIIGSGNMGASMGKNWAAKGRKVLRAVAGAAGPNARTGTPAGAVAFGELILPLSVPWEAVHEALKAARARSCSVASTA
jgi:predicted dinucleotide-binding enzyme